MRPSAAQQQAQGEADNRLRKAHSLAAALHSVGATAGAALAMPDKGWRDAAELASLRDGRRVNPPGSQATKDLVATLLAARAEAEANQPADPVRRTVLMRPSPECPACGVSDNRPEGNRLACVCGHRFAAEPIDLRCALCGKAPAELEEVQVAVEEENEWRAGQGKAPTTPDAYVWAEMGTLNRTTGRFLCTACYIDAGMPSLPAALGGWKVPDGYGNY